MASEDKAVGEETDVESTGCVTIAAEAEPSEKNNAPLKTNEPNFKFVMILL